MKGNGTVFCAGTFDGLHPGHFKFLRFAKKFGKRLVVVVGRDSSVARIKGHAPLFGEKDRLFMLQGLRLVDKALLGSKKNIFDSVKKVNSEVIVLGHDQGVNEAALEKFAEQNGLRVRKIVRAPKFSRAKYSNSRLKTKNPRFHKQI